MDLRRLEEIALNASGPANPRFYDGWLLGFTPAKPKRGRAVVPFYGSSLPLKDKIDACQRLYAEAALPFLVRLSPFSQPAELDGWLAARGYDRFDDTMVMARALDDWVADPPEPLSRFDWREMDHAAWTHETQGVRSLADEQVRRTVIRMEVLQLTGCGMIATCAGEVAGWGVTQIEDGCAGIYNVETVVKFRRAGLARQLVRALIDRAHKEGATAAYLQVTSDNAAALPLYAELGFVEAYRYWYRARPEVIAHERR